VLNYRATDVAGNQSATGTTFMIDATDPASSSGATPLPTNGFYHDPTIVLTGGDYLSGVDYIEYNLDGAGATTYSGAFQVTGDGPHSLDFHAVDLAGNVEATNNFSFNIDTTPPDIAISEPANGGSYPLGSSQAANYSCTDSNSGVPAGECVGTVADGDNFDTSSVGFHSFTVDAEDLAGNQSSQTIQYNVYWSEFTGFDSPITSGVTSRKAGSTVPIKFGLGGDFGLDIFMAGSPASREVDCTTHAPTGPLSPISSPGGSSLTYDDGVYQVNWKTDGEWADTCRELVVRLVDNTTHTALFSFH
jgi:hypothetical protein